MGTTVKELVPNYMDLLDQGLSHDEIKSIAKTRLTSPTVNIQEVPKEDVSMMDKVKQLSQDTMNSPSFGAQVAKGLANSFIKTAEMADTIKVPNVFSALGKMILPEDKQSIAETPKMPQHLIDLGEKLDEQKQKTSEHFISPDRKAQLDALNKENRNAQGILGNAKAGVKQMWDSATHPKEWTAQGITEFATDPTNALSLGLGHAMAKGVASPVLKFLAGSAAGGSENALIGAGTSYARARAEGKSEEEAQNIAIQSAAGGALVGSALGGVGGLSSHIKPNETPKIETKDVPLNDGQNTSYMDGAFSTLGESPTSHPEVKPVFDLVEAELKAQNDHIATQKFTDDMIQKGINDPVVIQNAIEQNISPTPIDMHITQLLNDGDVLPNSMSGARLAVKLNNTIEAGNQTPEAVYTKLKSIGASDELASKAAEAVQYKNPDIFYAWYTKKLEPMYKTSNTIEANVLPEQSMTQQSLGNETPLAPNKDFTPSENGSMTQQTAPNDTTIQTHSPLELNDAMLNAFENKAMPLNPNADILSLVKDFSQPIKTPLFESKISIDKLLNHIAEKDDFERRIEYINLIKPTLEEPLFITKEGDRYRFFKTFVDDKDKTVKFLTVLENDRGELMGVTATPIRNTDVRKLFKENVVWGGDMLSAENTPHGPLNDGGSLKESIAQTEQDVKMNQESNHPSHDPLDGIENDIAYKQAYQAHLGTSMDPEKRANSRINGYIESLRSDYDALKPFATNEEKLAQLNLRFGEYREKSKALYSDLLAKESRVLSPMITGPARFPVEANQKRMATVAKAREAFLDYQDRALKKMRSMLDPQESSVIRSNDVDALSKLQSKLENQQKNHDMMKQANAIMRSKESAMEKQAKLQALGFSDTSIKAIGKDGGFGSYALANSTQRMKQTQGRIMELKRLEQAEKNGNVSTLLYEGAKIEDNLAAKRVQIRFDEIPNAQTRTDLKKRGFKWSPKEEAWQRIITPDAKRAAQEIIDRHYTRAFDTVTKKMLEC